MDDFKNKESFEDITDKLKSLSKVKAPDDFVEKVHERLADRFDLLKALKKIFSMPNLGVSLKYAGSIAAILLFVGVYNYMQQGYLFTTFPETEEKINRPAAVAMKRKSLQAKQEDLETAVAAEYYALDASRVEMVAGTGVAARSEMAMSKMAGFEPGPVKINLIDLVVPSVNEAIARVKEIALLAEGKAMNIPSNMLAINIPATKYEYFIAELAKYYAFKKPAPDIKEKDTIALTIRITAN